MKCNGCPALTKALKRLDNSWNIVQPILFRKMIRIIHELHDEIHESEDIRIKEE